MYKVSHRKQGHKQFCGHKDDEKLHLGVLEQERFSKTGVGR
jgi:hypothetical protein